MVLCKDCNHELDEPTNIATENRSPCPCCGSTSRLFTVQTGGNIAPSGRLVGRKLSNDGTEAIRVSDSQKRSSATDLDTSGQLSYSIEGASPRGESDTLDVCRTLIHRLNMSGGQWGAPTVPDGPEGGIDCVANNGQQALYIQVTRAVSKQDIWRQLGRLGNATATATVQRAADDLFWCVQTKAQKIPHAQRSNLLLALDAMDTPGHALEVVIQDFQKRYGGAVRALGFQAIWVVGPLAELTRRLDT